MSFDAGGLAQMTYQSHFNNNAIGVSGPGFASRGKGNHIKRLSVAPPSKISTIDETQQANICATPRTARGHLLAGLRTAPKSATVSNNVNSFGGLEQSKYAVSAHPDRAPQTSQAAFFPNNQQHNNHNHNGANNARQGYSSPDQVLAPPTLDFGMDSMNGMDQNTYDELVATNNYLAHQQRMLQQQLMSVQAAAHQLGGLSLNTQNMFGGNAYQSPMTPMSIYQQQLQQGLQPIVSPVVGNPGVYTVYNPMTGQSSYVMDNSAMQPQSTGSNTPLDRGASPVDFNQQQRRSPPSMMPPPSTRSVSPPKQSRSPPQEVEPLPPPSANAFRRGHRKNASSVNIKTTSEWTRTAPRPAGVPATPMTGTFGPGQARAGDHPVRQPRNPPHLAELQEKPTAKHEGSKNFSARQRRRAVHDLVKAGRDRLSERNSGSESGTPGSEAEFNFSVSSGDHDVIVRSANLSSKNSSGSLAAIGSERKEKSRERSSVDSTRSYGARSLSSDEGHAVGGNIVEVESNRRRTPLLVLSSAEKRKSLVL